MSEEFLKRYHAIVKTVMDASMDPVCIVDRQNQILHSNLPMRSFLGIRTRELGKKPVFCDLVKLSICEPGCQLRTVLDQGSVVRVDESPAARGTEKLRISLRAVPIYAGGERKTPVGALITLRDTTGEILLQAKYHKLLEMMAAKDTKVAGLEERIRALRTALRRARVNAVGS